MKKLSAIILAVVMTMSLVACGGNGSSADLVETDLSSPVTINWIMPGPGMQKDSEMVFAKFNEELHKMKGFENVNVEIEVIPVADYVQKIMLMQTSGEKMDIIQTYLLDHATEYRNGSILDISEYLKKYAKDVYNEVPEWVIEMGKVDGGQAILPLYQKMVNAPYYWTIPADLQEYLDVEAMQKSFQAEKANDFVLSEESVKIIEDYLEKVHAAGKQGKGYTTAAPVRGTDTIISNYRIMFEDPELEVFNVHLHPQQQTLWRVKKYFYDKGYVRKDSLSAKAADFSGVKDGNLCWTSQNWTGKFEPYYNETLHDIPALQIPVNDKFYAPYKPAAGGFAVSVNSQYPDVAVKVIDLLNTKKGIELYNLLLYGIEGTHYEVVKELEDDKIIKPFEYAEEGTSACSYGLWKWIVGNAKYAWMTTYNNEGFKEIVYEYMNEGEDTIKSPLMGFALDSTSIETKLSQIKAVSNEFGGPLGSGAVDSEQLLKEMAVKYEQAGNQEIIDEIQRQIDEFIQNK